MGDVLPPGFVRAILEDVRLTDSMMDALEARVVALEEIASARGIRRMCASWRLGRSLRASVRHFPGSSFAERRFETAWIEWIPVQANSGKQTEQSGTKLDRA